MQAASILKTTLLSFVISFSLSLSSAHADEAAGKPLKLRILHMNDHHSHLNPSTTTLKLAGQDTEVELGGFARAVALYQAFEAKGGNILKLHAGDATTGDLYYTLFKGEADATMMNQICFDAFEVGNHEFDDGDSGLKRFLDYLKADTCNTPVLGANVIPRLGTSPLALTSSTDYIQPYIIKEYEGEKVGIIGVNIAGKTKNSSNPDRTTQFANEQRTAQQYINALRNQGINKIILLSHYGYENDLELAKNLRGVDVIVGGDSHSLLGGERLTSIGLEPSGPYPTQQTNKDGDPVCIVQAWQYSNAVGKLDVNFDRSGKITRCQGTPRILLGHSFKRNGQEVTGEDRKAIMAQIQAYPELQAIRPNPSAEAVLASYAAKVDVLTKEVIGSAAENLCLVRFPGEARSTICDPALTKSKGSDISNIVAKAFLEMSNTSDICIQNGGGVRTDVAAGNITIGTAYTLLPFANTLTEIEMTGQQILDVLEEAIDYALDPNGSSGAYPYASGLRWTLDLSKPFGKRFSNVEINSRLAGSWQAINRTKTYKVVTNSYTAGGKDGYLTFGDIPDNQKTDTFLDYAQSFVDYVKRETSAGRPVTKLPTAEYSTQVFIDKNGIQQ